MRTKDNLRNRRTIPILFVCAVIIRYLLAIATSAYPSVGIDEFLYYNLARSIATKGRLLFHGQPADYAYILYPLVISPVYLFFREGANFYRIIQLWNIILMSASIFPINALCRRMLRDDRKALCATVLGMLLPEFMLGQLIFSEGILFPMFFALAYLIYGYLDGDAPKGLLAVGMLGGAMYSVKPGSMIPAALFLIVALIGALAKKKKRNALFAAGGLLAFCAVVALFWGLARGAFGYRGKALSIYGAQIAGAEGWHLDVFARSALTYPYYFVLSCGIVGFAYPFLTWRYWEERDRKFWRFTLAALIAMMIGTAWVINRSEFETPLLHIRYVAMYIPLMALFCFLPYDETAAGKGGAARSKDMIRLGALLSFVVALTLVWGCKTGAQTRERYPLTSLSVLIDQAIPLSSQWIGNAVVIALCAAAFLVFFRWRGKKALQRLCIACLALFMLVNGVCAYVFNALETAWYLAEDGREALRLADGHDFVYLKTTEGQVDGGIDVNTRQNLDMVLMNDLINHLSENQGRYEPFVPVSLRGYYSDRPTADVDVLVLDDASFSLMKPNPSATSAQAVENAKFCVVRFTPGERLADSVVGNVFNRVLRANLPGILLIFDEALLQRPLTLRLYVRSNRKQSMRVFCESESHTVELDEGLSWYEVTFENPMDAFNFVVEDEDVKLYEYELVA